MKIEKSYMKLKKYNFIYDLLIFTYKIKII